MPKWLWVLTSVAVLAVGAYFYVLVLNPFSRSEGAVACTADAMQCPDGSWVGRSGPRCEFVCPAATSSGQDSQTVTLAIGESATVLGVYIKPTDVLEDSRCPADVECIQAGTVRARVTLAGGLGLGEYNATLALGTPLTTEAEQVTLTAVAPERRAGAALKTSDYRFTFTVEKRGE